MFVGPWRGQFLVSATTSQFHRLHRLVTVSLVTDYVRSASGGNIFRHVCPSVHGKGGRVGYILSWFFLEEEGEGEGSPGLFNKFI